MFKALFAAFVLIATAPAAGGLAYGQGLGAGLGRVEIGARAPDLSLTGADGRRHSLGGYRGKIVVLEWTSPVCPYTRARYDDGVIQGLQKAARAQGVVWLTINTSAKTKPGFLTPAAAKARVAATGATVSAFLLDNGGKVARRYGARTTPSFFIIGKDGRLAYQGALDDDFFARGEASTNFVSAALTDLAARRSVRTPETRPYGCAIEY